jgi:hypothetical protein
MREPPARPKHRQVVRREEEAEKQDKLSDRTDKRHGHGELALHSAAERRRVHVALVRQADLLRANSIQKKIHRKVMLEFIPRHNSEDDANGPRSWFRLQL